MSNNLPTDAEVDALIQELEELIDECFTDNGDESEILPGWDELWAQHEALCQHPYYFD